MRLLGWTDGITSTAAVLKSSGLSKSVPWKVKFKSVSSSFRDRFGIQEFKYIQGLDLFTTNNSFRMDD